MNNHFEGLEYAAEELSAYIFCIDTFVISLKNGEIIRYVAEDPDVFIGWLKQHNIRDINNEIGKMVYNHYFR